MKKETQQSHENNDKHGRCVFASGRKWACEPKVASKHPLFQRITSADWKKVLANVWSRQRTTKKAYAGRGQETIWEIPMKYVLPSVNAVLFVIVTGFVWRWPFKDHNWLIEVAKWAFPIIGIFSTIYGVRYGRRFKRVQVDDMALYVSDYKTEVRIPFSDIENASVKWKLHGHGGGTPVVTVEFRDPTVLGKQIEFIAAEPWNLSHSMVAELREWRDRARS